MVKFKILLFLFSLAWRNCESRYENRKFEEIISAINNLQANLYVTNQKIEQLQNDVENIREVIQVSTLNLKGFAEMMVRNKTKRLLDAITSINGYGQKNRLIILTD